MLIALLATAGVGVFAAAVIQLDRELRNEQIETELLRLGDEASREISFVDDVLEPEDPDLDRVVVAVNPSFSVREFEEQQDRFGFDAPSDDAIGELMSIVFEEQPQEEQVFLLEDLIWRSDVPALWEHIDLVELLDDGATTVEEFEYDDGDEILVYPTSELFRDDMVDQLVEDPPGDLFDEAYRRFVIEQADEAGVDLQFPTVFVGDDAILASAELSSITERVTDDGGVVEDEFDAADDSTRVIRAVALRDGPEVRGAVIAVLDPAQYLEEHLSLRRQVLLLAVLTVLGSVVAAWFVAGRTTRPVARALGQQERFLADAAHELRTPIAAIRLTAESADVTTRAASTAGAAEASLARVAELAADASTLTDDLLTLARMDADRVELQTEPVRLDLLVESTLASIPGADASVVPAEMAEVVVVADPRLLQRAVTNLVRNAIAHGAATPANTASISVTIADGRVVLRVRDRGAGVDPELGGELFERFRSRTGSSGHGLGLPLARWIARAHGGDLSLVPTDGPGTTFRLELPRP